MQTQTHTEVLLALCGTKAQRDRLARRAGDEDLLAVARSITSKLFGNVCFQASARRKKEVQTDIFLLQHPFLCMARNNTYISV